MKMCRDSLFFLKLSYSVSALPLHFLARDMREALCMQKYTDVVMEKTVRIILKNIVRITSTRYFEAFAKI